MSNFLITSNFDQNSVIYQQLQLRFISGDGFKFNFKTLDHFSIFSLDYLN